MAKTKKANFTPEQKIVQKQLKKGVAPLADYMAKHVKDFEKPEYQAALREELQANADILLFNTGISPFNDKTTIEEAAKFIAQYQHSLDLKRCCDKSFKPFTQRDLDRYYAGEKALPPESSKVEKKVVPSKNLKLKQEVQNIWKRVWKAMRSKRRGKVALKPVNNGKAPNLDP